jgi:hypothetical protein
MAGFFGGVIKGPRIQWSRLAAGLAMLVVASVTGIISYSHIYELTLALHQHEMAARLWAFGIDGLIVAGSLVLLQAVQGQPRWLGWLGVGPGVLLSVFANVESGIRYGLLASAWAGTPAVSFALTTFMLERWLKAQHEARRAAAGDTAVAAPGTISQAPEPVAPAAPQAGPVPVHLHGAPAGAPWGLVSPAAAPVPRPAPAFAVPVMGPAMNLVQRRASRPRVARAAADDSRLPLPSDPAELAAALAGLSRNKIFETYQVPKMKASALVAARDEGRLGQWLEQYADERAVA